MVQFDASHSPNHKDRDNDREQEGIHILEGAVVVAVTVSHTFHSCRAECSSQSCVPNRSNILVCFVTGKEAYQKNTHKRVE